MDKAKVNFLVDLLLLVSFIVTALTSLIIFFFLPSGVRQGGYQIFLGIAKNTYSSIHTFFGFSMIALSIVHLILHWNWLVCMVKNMLKQKEECKTDK